MQQAAFSPPLEEAFLPLSLATFPAGVEAPYELLSAPHCLPCGRVLVAARRLDREPVLQVLVAEPGSPRELLLSRLARSRFFADRALYIVATRSSDDAPPGGDSWKWEHQK